MMAANRYMAKLIYACTGGSSSAVQLHLRQGRENGNCWRTNTPTSLPELPVVKERRWKRRVD